jgi:hypothetical protein
MFPFGAILFSSQFLIAVTGGVPNIDVKKDLPQFGNRDRYPYSR